jgi:hypothetical protein
MRTFRKAEQKICTFVIFFFSLLPSFFHTIFFFKFYFMKDLIARRLSPLSKRRQTQKQQKMPMWNTSRRAWNEMKESILPKINCQLIVLLRKSSNSNSSKSNKKENFHRESSEVCSSSKYYYIYFRTKKAKSTKSNRAENFKQVRKHISIFANVRAAAKKWECFKNK